MSQTGSGSTPTNKTTPPPAASTTAAPAVPATTVKFKLNGQEVTVPKGWTVMQAAKHVNTDIPHFCWHPGLSVAGVCRFCMVKVEGRPKLEIACNLIATEGMDVKTTTDEVKDAHKWGLEFHLINHPLDCPICDQAGECGLQNFYMSVGKYQSQMTRPKTLKPKALEVGGDLVLDTERCILCSRCVRFEEEITKTDALGIFDRGDRAIVGTYPGKKLSHQYTANLVDICPVGAFTSKDFRFRQRVWFLQDKKSICPGCSTGCATRVFAKPETRTYFRMKPRESDVNKFWMCDPGRKQYQHLNSPSRLLAAYVGESSLGRKAVTTEVAAQNLFNKIQSTDASKIALLVTAQYTNEEYAALFQYFVKDRGIKNVFQWRSTAEKIDEFDGLLLRGDRNANTNGLLRSMKDFGLGEVKPANQIDSVLGQKFDLVIALAPEILMGFNNLAEDLEKLSKLSYVSLWTLHASAVKDRSFGSVIPMRGFAEKKGHFTNFSGELRQLEEASLPPQMDLKDVCQVVDILRSLGARKEAS